MRLSVTRGMGTNTWGIAKAKRFDAVKVPPLVIPCYCEYAARTPRAMAWLIAPRGLGLTTVDHPFGVEV